MTTSPRNPGWAVQLAIHRAVRRDARRLASALAVGHEAPPADIWSYWMETAHQLHDHHVLEDAVVWPLMGERLGDRVAALLARNEREHQAMAVAMDQFGTALATAATEAAAARTALTRLVAAVETHLAHEEADVLPLIPEAFSLDDLASFSAASAKTNPPWVFLPWVLDEAPDEDRALFIGTLPEPLRAELERDWLPRRGRVVEALRVQTAAA